MQELTVEDKSEIEKAVRAVRDNKLIVIPTDTVYGIGISPISADNIDLLLKAKGRGRQKPPPILVADIAQAKEIAEIEDRFMPILDKFWPGALTVVFPMKTNVNWDLGYKNSTVALRMPDNDLTLELLSFTGPLAVSSANKTSFSPALEIDEAVQYFGQEVEVYIDGGKAKLGISSTIIDLTSNVPEILRKGDVTLQMLREYIPDIIEK